MRSLIFIALAGLQAGPAAAAEIIQVSSNFNAQVFIADETDPKTQEQERSVRQSMYERAARECELLRASIALTCRITSIGVSTQINRSPGQPPALYINSNVSMEVTLK